MKLYIYAGANSFTEDHIIVWSVVFCVSTINPL